MQNKNRCEASVFLFCIKTVGYLYKNIDKIRKLVYNCTRTNKNAGADFYD